MTGLEVTVRCENATGVVGLAGEARMELVPRLQGAVDDACEQGARDLILDMSRLRFMDSASAGELLRIKNRVAKNEGRLVLVGLRSVVQRLMDAAGLHEQFTIAPDEEAARLYLGGI